MTVQIICKMDDISSGWISWRSRWRIIICRPTWSPPRTNIWCVVKEGTCFSFTSEKSRYFSLVPLIDFLKRRLVKERVRGGRRQEAPVHQRLQRQRGDGRRHPGAAGALDGRPLLPAGGRRARLQLAPHEGRHRRGECQAPSTLTPK